MFGRMMVGIAVGVVLGAVGAMALTGDLNKSGMNKITKNVEKQAKNLGL